nr:hypothetical protein [Tanacetum cinerariifolium]
APFSCGDVAAAGVKVMVWLPWGVVEMSGGMAARVREMEADDGGGFRGGGGAWWRVVWWIE